MWKVYIVHIVFVCYLTFSILMSCFILLHLSPCATNPWTAVTIIFSCVGSIKSYLLCTVRCQGTNSALKRWGSSSWDMTGWRRVWQGTPSSAERVLIPAETWRCAFGNGAFSVTAVESSSSTAQKGGSTTQSNNLTWWRPTCRPAWTCAPQDLTPSSWSYLSSLTEAGSGQ